MSIAVLSTIDLSAWEQPDPNLEPRALLQSWLRYQRHEFLGSASSVEDDLRWYFEEVDKAEAGGDRDVFTRQPWCRA